MLGFLGGRRKSREILFRILYETEISGRSRSRRWSTPWALPAHRRRARARRQAAGLWSARREEIDALLRERVTNWELGRLSAVVRAVLRLSTAELMGAPDVPAASSSIRRSSWQEVRGGGGGTASVNGVLDPIGAALRPARDTREGQGG